MDVVVTVPGPHLALALGFAVWLTACDEASAPAASSLTVVTSTSGESLDLDADGYGCVLDDGETQPLEANDSVTYTGISSGTHVVELVGLAGNCSVRGGSRRNIDVPANSAARTTFEVECALSRGDLQIVAVTSGVLVDVDGYWARLDGRQARQLNVNSSTTFVDLRAGEYTVELRGIASNCEVSGENPRNLTVSIGSVTTSTFDVLCRLAFTGPIAFTTLRYTYPNPEIALLWGDGQVIRFTDTEVYVADPALSPGGQRIAFSMGDFEVPWMQVFVADIDGSGLTNLSYYMGDNLDPAWSPDGQRIAFTSDRAVNFEIIVMDADGSNQWQLTDGGIDVMNPAWSPDGAQIAFARVGSGIMVMDADGSDVVQLTSGVHDDPTWSPDGSMIAFSNRVSGSYEIWVVNVDGSGASSLISSPGNDFEPAWSPDGTKIAFASDRDGSAEIYLYYLDGSGLIRLTYEWADDWEPAWPASR